MAKLTEDEEIELDHRWYCFRQLSFYISCLYDEESITGKTYETLNSALGGFKPDLKEGWVNERKPEKSPLFHFRTAWHIHKTSRYITTGLEWVILQQDAKMMPVWRKRRFHSMVSRRQGSTQIICASVPDGVAGIGGKCWARQFKRWKTRTYAEGAGIEWI